MNLKRKYTMNTSMKRKSGQAMTEYIIIVVVVALAAVGIAGLVLGSISYLVLPRVRQAR